ncbi:MAG: sugar nucleotide-binding protein [Bacteriovoracaceae bacterium]|nr:sugar nucleotide-binding protein [Bacteriovoracaceae bacterium]
METNEQQKTILIIGISSFVGANLAEFFKNKYRVVGTYKDNPTQIKGVLTVPCNVLVKDEIQLVLFAFKPDVTIYCAGLSGLNDCANSDGLADSLNTMGLFNVAEYCQRYKSQIVSISSCYVFGGEDKEYVEMDIPDSTTVLGKTKAQAEFYIQKTSLNYLIFRCCNFYGRTNNANQMSMFERMQKTIKNNESVDMDAYVRTGHLDVYYLAMLMDLCFQQDASNRLYQVSSSDIMSPYDFAKTYCEVFGEGESLVTQGRWFFPYVVSATSNYGGGDLFYKLDVKNIEGTLNIKMPSIKESLEFSYQRFGGIDNSSKRVQAGGGVTFI